MLAAKPLTVWAWSLGCPKNRVDTERLLGSLGLPVRLVSSPVQARLVLINTCAFIESATRESLAAIFETAQKLRKLKKKPLLAVAGCLPGRYGTETLAPQIPEVDLWLDTNRQEQWPQMVLAALHRAGAPERGRLNCAVSYAWLKIAEGCRHHCAYCTIPVIRGPLRSICAEELLSEAQMLIASGVKELDLVAQDTAAWGQDLPKQNGRKLQLADLLEKLARLSGLSWLRLFYLYPDTIRDELLQRLAAIGAPFLPYFDLPLQHSQSEILKRMLRPAQDNAEAVIERIYKYFPTAALRATLMVGFPGETDADFLALCDFVCAARFHNLGVFAFEAEEGTKAATMPDQVPQVVRRERRDELMRLQADISRGILAGYVGGRQHALVDAARGDAWPGLFAGRVWFQAPEVDGVTYISGPGVEVGRLIECEIVDAQTYDLSALV